MAVTAMAFASACSTMPASIRLPPIFGPGPGEPVGRMTASWYGAELRGKRTASGEAFDPDGFTCAHRELPFGTVLRVRNPRTGATAIVTVNDRGPFVAGRDLDLSRAAARRLGMVSAGVAEVDVEIVERGAGIVDGRRVGSAVLGE